MFEIRLDEVFKSDLGDKVVDTIVKIGKPDKILYSEYDTDVTTHYTAKLIYEQKEEDGTESSN